ncbi:uncharacterized protein LOC132281274 [Cornus florida]|uniref:uncharacterized protein LOC132281274 n=1 Tax=Cornus florida TaxID=4283 RepID=UPI0028987DFB|nr:uncharacterized protein LOC132281274 [Cornus florida]
MEDNSYESTWEVHSVQKAGGGGAIFPTNSSENPGLQITTVKLDGSNYLIWAQSAKMFIGGKGKIGYITGSEKEPAESEKIWDSVQRTYSQRQNNARIFQLGRDITRISQGDLTVSGYIAKLRAIWEEMSYYDSFHSWKDPDDAVLYAGIVEKNRVFQFLTGLNDEFKYARESRRTHPLGIASVDRSAMAVRIPNLLGTSPSQSVQSTTTGPLLGRQRGRCDYFGKIGHIKSRCYALHGRPPQQKQQPQSSAHSVTQPVSLSTPDNPASTSSATVTLTQADLDNVSTSSTPWIIDSGASDNMTGMSSLFQSYSIYSGQRKVRLADGSPSSIAGKGHISVTPSLTLSNTLHVPKLTTNLISDLVSKRTIGSGREVNGLYLLDAPLSLQAHSASFSNITQFGRTIKKFRSDQGTEYTYGENGRSERKNRHILDLARVICIGINVLQSFWRDAVLTAVYIINRTPSRILNFAAPLSILHPNSSLFLIPP